MIVKIDEISCLMPGYQLMHHLSGNLMISLNNIWSQAGRSFHIISQMMEDEMVPKNSTSDSDVTRETTAHWWKAISAQGTVPIVLL